MPLILSIQSRDIILFAWLGVSSVVALLHDKWGVQKVLVLYTSDLYYLSKGDRS